MQVLQSRLADFEAEGVGLVAIGADGPEDVRAMMARDALGFPVLSDPELRAIEAYGVRLGDHAEPATFVVGSDGRIAWRDVETRADRRAGPDEILAALR